MENEDLIQHKFRSDCGLASNGDMDHGSAELQRREAVSELRWTCSSAMERQQRPAPNAQKPQRLHALKKGLATDFAPWKGRSLVR